MSVQFQCLEVKTFYLWEPYTTSSAWKSQGENLENFIKLKFRDWDTVYAGKWYSRKEFCQGDLIFIGGKVVQAMISGSRVVLCSNLTKSSVALGRLCNIMFRSLIWKWVLKQYILYGVCYGY